MSDKEYLDIMIDLETMSTQTDAAIISIGAVIVDFENEEYRSRYYSIVDLKSSIREGGHLDPDTVMWWMNQSEDAKVDFRNHDHMDIKTALHSFSIWVKEHCKEDPLNNVSQKTPRIWGNGATFDNVVLRGAYERIGWEIPWHFSGDMCYRTMKNLHRHIEADDIKGTKHNALADAKFQAIHLIKILKSSTEQKEGN